MVALDQHSRRNEIGTAVEWLIVLKARPGIVPDGQRSEVTGFVRIMGNDGAFKPERKTARIAIGNLIEEGRTKQQFVVWTGLKLNFKAFLAGNFYPTIEGARQAGSRYHSRKIFFQLLF